MATVKNKKSKKDKADKVENGFELAIDNRVRISDDNGQVTDDIWIVDAVDDAVIELSHSESALVKRVHRSRIATVVTDDATISNPSFKTEPDVEEQEPAKVKASKPKTRKNTTQPEPVDFSKLADDGEVWAKDVPFDHPGQKVQAHCIIAKDGKSFCVFNTYNGAYGKKGQNSTKFDITDLKALVRKRQQLKKQGYELTFENDELNQLIETENAGSQIEL